MPCARCRHDNRPLARFCEGCGTPLETSLPSQPYADLKPEVETLQRALTQALERETASADLLRIISASPTDLAPVFEMILDRALSLCDAMLGGVARYDGRLVSVVAVQGPPALAEAARAAYPRRVTDVGL